MIFMSFHYDFNDPNLISSYLEQALPQAGLEHDRKKFVIGHHGGIGYGLFSIGFRYWDCSKANVATYNDLQQTRDYFGVIGAYIETAKTYAQGKGFGLVSILPTNIGDRLTHFDRSSPFHSTGIGEVRLESLERLEGFLRMIKEGKPALEEQYQKVTASAKDLFVHFTA
ncbi:MAG TPA: hypothetical protein VJA18_02130 [Candidatus Nanoarchaeia archaeon]|nr:hypothetical protein [Candidatus Nanoarchaeia archaeon]